MSGKVSSLFQHPEFSRRSLERAERELAERVLPPLRLSSSRRRCRTCSSEYEVVPRLPSAGPAPSEECPRCAGNSSVDALDAFLRRLFDANERG